LQSTTKSSAHFTSTGVPGMAPGSRPARTEYRHPVACSSPCRGTFIGCVRVACLCPATAGVSRQDGDRARAPAAVRCRDRVRDER
jgi:hypothetical protein